MISKILSYLKKYKGAQKKNIVKIQEKIKKINSLNELNNEDKELIVTKQEKEIISLEKQIRYATEMGEDTELIKSFDNSYTAVNAMESTVLKNEHIFIIVHAYIHNKIFIELKIDSKRYDDETKKGFKTTLNNAYETIKAYLLIDTGYAVLQSTQAIKKGLYESLVNVGYSDYESKEIVSKLFKRENTKQLQKPTGAKHPTDTQNIRVYADGKILAKTANTFKIKSNTDH